MECYEKDFIEGNVMNDMFWGIYMVIIYLG